MAFVFLHESLNFCCILINAIKEAISKKTVRKYSKNTYLLWFLSFIFKNDLDVIQENRSVPERIFETVFFLNQKMYKTSNFYISQNTNRRKQQKSQKNRINNNYSFFSFLFTKDFWSLIHSKAIF